MKPNLRIAIAQINAAVGDLEGNAEKILDYINSAKKGAADIVVLPELALCGYPPEDLLHKKIFIDQNLKEIKALARKVRGITAIVGFVDRQKKAIYNAAAVIADGKIKAVYHKTHLPNYGVFDEKRYFQEGREPLVFKVNGIRCAINICEDIWYPEGPLRLQAAKGAKIVFVINASPYFMGKVSKREEIIRHQAVANGVFIAYTNLVGGQDELVFDGQSFITDQKGRVIAMAAAFKEELLIADTSAKLALPDRLFALEEVYQALVLGLRDYVRKNGFKKVVIGLSGGVDSALTAAIAKDALGRENVIGVFMPSMYTSKKSADDSLELSRRLGIKLYKAPINGIYRAYLKGLRHLFDGYKKDNTEENIQARIRGNILMAISNKFRCLVLATGNKSEVSCGYCTLYGDMAGGFSVLKDVPKTLVYKLSKLVVNRHKEVIPRSIIERPPTAELRPNQRDTDTLPPYDILDPIIEAYVEEDKSLQEIVKARNRKPLATKVVSMIDSNEYKRRQASPGVKITPKAFGKDRRMPITNRFVEK
ncbi:MAG: NAD+ synthase [Candidatus Omnitrophica bacterium]|nr:NAD+ synthase [Candidatus Omnitrophota bacterium]